MPDKINPTTYFGIIPEYNKNNALYTRDTVAKKLFEFLCREQELTSEEISLCTGSGTVLSAFPAKNAESPMYSEISSDFIRKQKGKNHTQENPDFIIAASSQSSRMDEIRRLCKTFTALLSLFVHNEVIHEWIFDGLDALQTSICIYDKDANLIYANLDFCNYAHIKDRDAVYGRHIDDVLSEIGIKFISTKKKRKQMKIMDVLEYGNAVLDWEVEVVSAERPNEYQLASNDMYPFFDKNGDINGAVEISRSRHKQIAQLRNALGLTAEYTFDDILGESRSMLETKKLAMTFAATPYNILIYGESGVGKEMFAQSIHNYSDRKNGPFVAINCASIPAELIDSELFGYESGAFTGASKKGQVGKFELANGGTLFLDEVAELPLHFQTKLLRTLETNQITRIGSSKTISVDVRILAATNQSLEKMIKDGLFRNDLYYRLMILNVEIPPLRNHPEDIISYGEFFLKQAAEKSGLAQKALDESAKALLMQYDWPGNIRELRNVMNRANICTDALLITREDLQASLYPESYALHALTPEKPPEVRIREKMDAVDRSHAELISEALSISGGNKVKAADLLGVSRRTFYRMLEKYKAFLDK